MKLTAQERTVFGKKVAGLRADGFVPGEIYGHGTDNVHLSIPRKELHKVLATAGKTDLIQVEIDGATHQVLAQDWVRDMHSGNITHIDFLAIKKGAKVNVIVPISFVGEAPAEKSGEGLISYNLTDIEIEGPAGKLPHEIEVSLDELNEVGDAVHISDLKVAADIDILTDNELMIVGVSEIREEEEPEEVEEVDLDAVEVEGEKKEEDEEETKEV